MLSELNFGWIDYSNEDRNRVMAVLNALTEPSAVDEIGIGVIRDGFADRFFPGTSTVQTRAKYFLLVPYLLMELEKESGLNPKKFLDKLDIREKDLIEILDKDNAEGVIGRRSRYKLKRKPSSIYWNGLRKLGIFKDSKFTLDQYSKAFFLTKQNEVERKVKRVDDEDCSDDSDVGKGEIVSKYFRCIEPDKNWRDTVTIDLTFEEGEYLKSRIIKSPYTSNTLLGYIIKNNITKICEIESFDVIGEIVDLPESIKKDYEMARDFSDFIYGATIRYNYILHSGDNEEVNEVWNEWRDSPFVKNKFSGFDIDAMLNELNIRDIKLKSFLYTFKECILNNDMERLDEAIVKREEAIKTKSRRKLNNQEHYKVSDDTFRGNKLEYRFGISKKIMLDIFNATMGGM